MSNQESIPSEGKTPGSVTLKQAAEEYINHMVLSNAKMTSVNVYQRALQIAVDFFGADRKLESISLLQVGKFYASDNVNKHPDNEKPKAEATVRQIRRVFRQCLEHARQ